MKKYIVGLVGLLVALTLGTSLQAQHGHWSYLGDAHVNGTVDHDRIKVGHSDGKFRAIQLRVSEGEVEFDRVLVHFGNGTQEELPVRYRIPAGGSTLAIDLPGDRRVIESVELWYHRDKWEHMPRVALYGLR